MLDNYINNWGNIVPNILFICFKSILIILVSILILSLILLAIGCLIKSQKMKTNFLVIVPSLLLIITFLLLLPFIFVHFKNYV